VSISNRGATYLQYLIGVVLNGNFGMDSINARET
jgi:hypothetical protein